MKVIVQFIKFGIVGLSNTIIGYFIYALSLHFFRYYGICKNMDIFLSQFIMFILSVAWSFYWNNKCVFISGERRNILSVLLKTYISYAFTSLLLSEILLHIWVNIIGLNEYIAPILNLIITVPLNFIIQKKWAYK